MRQDARKALNQTADLAARALHFLIADGKLALRDVTTALSRRKKLIKQLKDRFTALETEVTAGAAKARKAASHRTASSRPRKTASGRPRKTASVARKRKAAARKAVSAKATKAARAVTKKKTVARSARKSASAPKATASRKPAPHTRPRSVAAKTKKPAQISVTAGTTQPTTPRPVADTESSKQTVAAAPAPKTTRKLPNVANPLHEGTGSGPRGTSQI